MRESVIDVLFYLFDDLLEQDLALQSDPEQMFRQLSAVGFASEDVRRAVNWFYALSDLNDYTPSGYDSAAIRIFSSAEHTLLGDDSIDYLRGLMRDHLIGLDVIEKIIERALALEEALDLTTVQWITAMVVLNVYGILKAGTIPDAMNTLDFTHRYVQ